MNYVAILHDGDKIEFGGDHLKAVEAALANKTPIRLNGSLVAGSSIARIGFAAGHSREFGPHSPLSPEAEAVFLLPESQKTTGFWEKALRLNQERKAQGKTWLFGAVIKKAMEETSFTMPEDLFALIDAEWDTFQKHNSPAKRIDWEAKGIAREYLATEEGKQYVSRWPARSYA